MGMGPAWRINEYGNFTANNNNNDNNTKMGQWNIVSLSQYLNNIMQQSNDS